MIAGLAGRHNPPFIDACPGSSDRVFLRFVASRARTRRLEDIRPAIQHRHHVVAVTHVGNAENPRFFGDIKPTVV
jgi:hypothetical protein